MNVIIKHKRNTTWDKINIDDWYA